MVLFFAYCQKVKRDSAFYIFLEPCIQGTNLLAYKQGVKRSIEGNLRPQPTQGTHSRRDRPFVRERNIGVVISIKTYKSSSISKI